MSSLGAPAATAGLLNPRTYDAAEFDEWLGVHQERHRRELVGVLERLTRLEIEGDELDDEEGNL